MSKKLKIGIIGAGGICRNVHLPSLSEIENCEVVAICDHHEEKAREMAEKYGIPKIYTLHHEMLKNEEMDAVFALVQPDKTYRVAKEVMEAGFHVMLEKPAGIDAYQAHSLARVSQRTGKIAAVAMNRRHIPLVQEVLKRMRAVTDIVQVDGRFMKISDIADAWHYASAYNCDIVHAIDVVRYIAGAEPVSAGTVVGRYGDSPVDNAWNSVIIFENGITGTLRSNYQAAARVHDIEIHGPRASAFIDIGFPGRDSSATIVYGDGASIYSAAAAGVNQTNVETLYATEVAGGDKYHQYYGYKSEDIDFVESILEGRTPMCTIADAAKTMDMVEMLLRSRVN